MEIGLHSLGDLLFGVVVSYREKVVEGKTPVVEDAAVTKLEEESHGTAGRIIPKGPTSCGR